MNPIFYAFLLSIFLLLPQGLRAGVERKIVIQDGRYYYFSIDEESQMSIVHTALLGQRIVNEQRMLFPLGRELSDPYHPLCFDIRGDELVGVNWILNSMNSRAEAIKKIRLKDWNKARPGWTIEDWAIASFDQPTLAINSPWLEMLEDNNVLDRAFFDVAWQGGRLWMIVSNAGVLYLWSWQQGLWQRVALIRSIPSIEYASLVFSGATIALLTPDAQLYRIDTSAAALVPQAISSDHQAQILVVDKDAQKNYLMPLALMEAATRETMQQLLDQAQEIILPTKKEMKYEK